MFDPIHFASPAPAASRKIVFLHFAGTAIFAALNHVAS
jgi:hypothetical protein